MKNFVVLLVVAIILSGVTFAQEKSTDLRKQEPAKLQPSEFSWQGYLVDATSAREIIKDPETWMKKASEYTRASALKESNVSSGFGIITEGKWLRFDQAGDKQALDLIKKSKREKGLMVTVTGRLDAGKITVTSIKEYTEKSPVIN